MKIILAILFIALLITLVLGGSHPYGGRSNDFYDKNDGSYKDQYDAKNSNYYENDNAKHNSNDNYYKDDAANKVSKDNYYKRENYADKNHNQKNTHADEYDDLDKYNNRLKYDKAHSNNDDRFANTKYNNHVDDAYLDDYGRVNKVSKHQKQGDRVNEDSAADHYETTDNQNHDAGVSYGGYGDHGGDGAKHGSSKKHTQKHGFKKHRDSDWINNFDIDAADAENRRKENKVRRGTAFENTKAAKNQNKDSIYFENDNASVKQRRGKVYDDNYVNSNSKQADTKIDKNNYNQVNARHTDAANKNNYARVDRNKNSNSNIAHGYKNSDNLHKRIASDKGSAGYGGYGGYGGSGSYGNDHY